MKAELSTFAFSGCRVRVVTDENGEPWWVAVDVLAALGYSRNATALFARVPDEWRSVKSVLTEYGERGVVCLSEPGLYFFLSRSDKPVVLPFQKWLAGEVLPAIRKHGVYATPATAEAILNDPRTMIKILEAYVAEQEKCIALEGQVERDKPVVMLGKAIIDNDRLYYFREAATMLHQNGIPDMGEKRLFAWMRGNGYLRNDMKHGNYTNEPTQRAMDMGIFHVVAWSKDGRIFTTTKLTGKGMEYFVNLFLGRQGQMQVT